MVKKSQQVNVGQIRAITLQVMPTDHIGLHHGQAVRIWQGVSEDGSNFVLYVCAFMPIAGYATDEILETLDNNAFQANPGLPLPTPQQAIAFVDGRPDGIERDGVTYDDDLLN